MPHIHQKLVSDYVAGMHATTLKRVTVEHSDTLAALKRAKQKLAGKAAELRVAEDSNELRAEVRELKTSVVGLEADERTLRKVVIPQMRRRIRQLRTKRGIHNVVALAKRYFDLHHYMTPANRVTWDSVCTTKIGCPNGVLDVAAGSLVPGHPLDFIRTVIPTAWRSADEPCPLWTQTLAEIRAGDPESIVFLQTVLGYAMTGQGALAKLMMWYGADGRNGKDLLLRLVKYVLGKPTAKTIPYACLFRGRNQRAAAANGHQAHLKALEHVHLGVISEVEPGTQWSVRLVKELTGGTEISARGAYEKDVTEFRLKATNVVNLNHLPLFVDPTDAAFWERVWLVPFTQRFVDEPNGAANEHRVDRTRAEQLQGEAAGILAWLVKGYQQYAAGGGGIVETASMKKAKQDYKLAADPVFRFYTECAKDKDSVVSASELHGFFAHWAVHQHVVNDLMYVPKQKTFGQRLRKFGGVTAEKRSTIHYRGLRIDAMPGYTERLGCRGGSSVPHFVHRRRGASGTGEAV